MTNERNEDWTEEALSGFAMHPAGQELRRRVLRAARAEWECHTRERRQLRRTARDTALAVAAALVVAFIVRDIDGRLTATVRPRALQTATRKPPSETEPAWLHEVGVATPLHRRMMAVAERRRLTDLGARRAFLEELARNGG